MLSWQRPNAKPWLRVVSLVTLFTFMLSNISWAGGMNVASAPALNTAPGQAPDPKELAASSDTELPSFLDSIVIESTMGWAIALEITVKAHIAGALMTEIPTVQFERAKGTSKFKLFKWLPSYLRWYFVAIKNHFFD